MNQLNPISNSSDKVYEMDHPSGLKLNITLSSDRLVFFDIITFQQLFEINLEEKNNGGTNLFLLANDSTESKILISFLKYLLKDFQDIFNKTILPKVTKYSDLFILMSLLKIKSIHENGINNLIERDILKREVEDLMMCVLNQKGFDFIRNSNVLQVYFKQENTKLIIVHEELLLKTLVTLMYKFEIAFSDYVKWQLISFFNKRHDLLTAWSLLFSKRFQFIPIISLGILMSLFVLINISYSGVLITISIISSAIVSLTLLVLIPIVLMLYLKDSVHEMSSLLIPKIGIFIIFGWLTTLPFSNDLWSLLISFQENKTLFYFLVVFLVLIVVLFFLVELKRLNIKYSVATIAKKYFYSLFVGLPVSYSVGVILMGLTVNKCDIHKKLIYKDIKLFSMISNMEYNLDLKKQDLNIINGIVLDDDFSQKKYYPLIADPFRFTFLFKKRKLEKEIVDCTINQQSIYFNFLAENCKKDFIPFVVRTKLAIIPYVFPPLIIIGGCLTFIIGYFINFISESSVYKNKE